MNMKRRPKMYLTDELKKIIMTIYRTAYGSFLKHYEVRRSDFSHCKCLVGVADSRLRVNSKLLSFVGVSFFIGYTINKYIPGSKVAAPYIEAIIEIGAFWIFIVASLHLMCADCYEGHGTFVQTLSSACNF